MEETTRRIQISAPFETALEPTKRTVSTFRSDEVVPERIRGVPSKLGQGVGFDSPTSRGSEDWPQGPFGVLGGDGLAPPAQSASPPTKPLAIP